MYSVFTASKLITSSVEFVMYGLVSDWALHEVSFRVVVFLASIGCAERSIILPPLVFQRLKWSR